MLSNVPRQYNRLEPRWQRSRCHPGQAILAPPDLWRQGQIDLAQKDQMFSKITLGLKDKKDDDDEPSKEDIATGFAIYSIVVFCSKESELLQTFLTRLVSDETPGTLLKVITNTLHSGKISLNMKKHLGKFYLALDKKLELNVGKIILAASSSSQISAM